MDKYSKIKEIGAGTFGKALLCFRNTDKAKCIIKQIAISKMDQKQMKLTELVSWCVSAFCASRSGLSILQGASTFSV